MERSRFDRHRQRVSCDWARDNLPTGRVVSDTPATRVVVRDARPSHVRRRSGHGRLLESRHRAPSGHPEPRAGGRARLAGGDFHVLRREAVRLLQPVRAERAHPRAGAIAQGSPPMVSARPPFPCAPGATSVLAPALVERESVEGATCAPLGAPGTVANRGALSGGPAQASTVGSASDAGRVSKLSHACVDAARRVLSPILFRPSSAPKALVTSTRVAPAGGRKTIGDTRSRLAGAVNASTRIRFISRRSTSPDQRSNWGWLTMRRDDPSASRTCSCTVSSGRQDDGSFRRVSGADARWGCGSLGRNSGNLARVE